MSKNEEILEAALKLFNKHGIDPVKTRDIAKAVGISLGNMTYYFPSKNDIIYSLCLQCIGEVDKAFERVSEKKVKNVMEMYYNQVESIYLTQLRFSFLFDKRYGEIIASLPDIQKHYQDVLKMRFDSFKYINTQLVNENMANQSLVKDSFAHGYIINMLALFWHQELTIYFPQFTDRQKVDHALAVYFQSYKPYLTKKGVAVLSPFLKKLEHY